MSSMLQNEKMNEYMDEYRKLIRCSSPYCNCGKCISKKYSHEPLNYRYEKNLQSSYKNEFNRKCLNGDSLASNRKKIVINNLGLDKSFKEYLKSSLVSVMKKDYGTKILENPPEAIYPNGQTNNIKENNYKKNFNDEDHSQNNLYYKKISNHNSNTHSNLNVYPNKDYRYSEKKSSKSSASPKRLKKFNNEKLENINNHDILSKDRNNNISSNNAFNEDQNKTLNPPFIGDSSYKLMYPDWGTEKIKKDESDKVILQNIPFKGKSSYKENFNRFESRYYIHKASPIIKNDNIESVGNFLNETTTKQTYRPINFKSYNDLNSSIQAIPRRPASLISAPYSKDSFLSSYERAFMYNNIKPKNINNCNAAKKSAF